MHKFILRVRHDDGWINIHTTAQSADAAREIVIAAERCPARAIRQVRAVDADGYELRADRPDRYRQLAVSDRRESFSRSSQSRPDKVPMPYEVQVLDEQRWRRVYATRHTGVRYIAMGGLKVMLVEDLP